MAPIKSSWCGRSLRGSRRSVRSLITRATKPSGTLIQKISDQCSWSVRNPPSIGPRMLALMNMIEVRPWTIGRSRGDNRSAMIVWAMGKRPPPPKPCSPRATIRTQMVVASARDGASDENCDRPEQNQSPPINIGQLAEQRRCYRDREQISGHHPRQIVDAAKAPADRRERRRDDGLFECRKKHRQHDPRDNGADCDVIEWNSGLGSAGKLGRCRCGICELIGSCSRGHFGFARSPHAVTVICRSHPLHSFAALVDQLAGAMRLYKECLRRPEVRRPRFNRGGAPAAVISAAS